MDSTFSFEKTWASWRWALLAAAILHAALRRFVSPPVSSDIMHYLLAARSVLITGRPDYLVAPVSDLTKAFPMPFAVCPLGYPVILAAALRVIPDPIWATLAIDWFFIAVCFISWFAVMEISRPPVMARLALWCAWAVAFDPFRHGGPTDWSSFAFLSAALALTAYLIQREKPAVLLASIAGLLIGAAAFVRYAYWPLVPALPFALLFIAWKDRRPLWNEAFAMEFASIISLTWIARSNLARTGHLISVNAAAGARGFYPQFLTRIFPFPAATFGLDDAASLFSPPLPPWVDFHLTPARLALLTISVVLVAFYGRALLRMLVSTVDGDARASALRFTHLAGALVVAVTFATIAGYSVRYPMDTNNLTGVQLERYWLPAVGPLSVLLAIELARWANTAARRRGTVTAIVVVGALCAFSFSQTLITGLRANGLQPDDRNIAAVQEFGTMLHELPQAEHVVYIDGTDFAFWGRGCASANGVPIVPLRDGKVEMKASSPVTAIVGLSRDGTSEDIVSVKRFCDAHAGRLIGTTRWGTLLYYAVDLPAGTYTL